MALQELLSKKQKGLPISAAQKRAPNNVINLMDALRESLKSSGGAATILISSASYLSWLPRPAGIPPHPAAGKPYHPEQSR